MRSRLWGERSGRAEASATTLNRLAFRRKMPTRVALGGGLFALEGVDRRGESRSRQQGTFLAGGRGRVLLSAWQHAGRTQGRLATWRAQGEAHGRDFWGSKRSGERRDVSQATDNCTIHWVRMKIRSVTETGKRHLFFVKPYGTYVLNEAGGSGEGSFGYQSVG